MTSFPDRPVSGRDRRPRLEPKPLQYQPSLGIDILITGDLVRSADVLPGDPTDDCQVSIEDPIEAADPGGAFHAPDAVFGEDRKGFGRFRLASNFIRVQIQGDDAKSGFGRMTNASVTGMFVRCQSPLPFRTAVRVDWILMNDMKMSFSGRVVRCTPQGMAIHLMTDDANWRFRAAFIDLCRTPTDKPPTAVVRKLTPAEAKRYREDDDLLHRLGEKWKSVQEDLQSDERHQAFIQECLKEKRLQFALERYRELQTWPVADFDPTPYLKQIGTILSFYQLSHGGPGIESNTLRRYLPLVMVTLLVMVILMGVPYLVGTQVTPPP